MPSCEVITTAPAGAHYYGDTTMLAFPDGIRTQPPLEHEPDAGELLVVATAEDDEVSRLKAGEAMSSVLLHATSFQLATCPLSQVLEVGLTRRLVRERVLNGFGYPQVIIRLGWTPIENPPLPASPRRPVDEVLSRFPDEP